MFDDYSDYIVHKQECGREMEKPKLMADHLRQFPGGVTRTQKPQYSLIPKCALDAMTARFELGQIKHGPTAWNAGAMNYESALTKAWVIAGLEHLIAHAMDAIKIIQTGIINLDKEEGLWENAGAIMFGGAVLAAYEDQRLQQLERKQRAQEPQQESND